jgi:hypothetical protein
VLVVDGANVIGSRPDGWWRDRPGAARRLAGRIRSAVYAGRVPAPVILVLEGRARDGIAEGTDVGVEIVHAVGEGDDTIARLVASNAACGHEVTAVTADRELARRVRSAGGEVVGPNWLLDRLPG